MEIIKKDDVQKLNINQSRRHKIIEMALQIEVGDAVAFSEQEYAPGKISSLRTSICFLAKRQTPEKHFSITRDKTNNAGNYYIIRNK